MRTPEQKAVWRRAQTFSLMAFVALGAVLLGLWLLLDRIDTKGYRDICEGALLVACYLAILTVNPMTNYFYSRLNRR